MSTPLSDESLKTLLLLLADHAQYDSVYWDEKLRFWVNVNDIFFWGCSDAEDITNENIPALAQALTDCESDSDAFMLFAARIRGMRPQGAVYKHIDRKLWPLFDACGPARESDFGNPVGSDKIEAYCSPDKAVADAAFKPGEIYISEVVTPPGAIA